ncbi:MAG: sigma-70 family RNA polymerase sigma factor [Candidatus Promineifilaceae bacterium]
MKKREKKPFTQRLKQAVREITKPDRPLHSPEQFGRLYQEKHMLVFRHIYGLCGGPTPLVEDLTAETFMRGWRARADFTGDSKAATGWLLRIARNLVIDHQRSGIERNTVLFSDDFEQGSQTGLPEEELILAEQQAVLITLLQELPLQKREMVTLRYLLEWRVREIADYLEIPENTVSVTIQRSLRQMRNRWPVVMSQQEQENVKI